MPEPTEYISLKRAAELLGVTTETIRRWVDDGKLASWRTLGGHRRVLLADVMAARPPDSRRVDDVGVA